MDIEERRRIQEESFKSMEDFNVYQIGETTLTRIRTRGAHTYRVEHGQGRKDSLVMNHFGVQAAISTFCTTDRRSVDLVEIQDVHFICLNGLEMSS